MCQTVKRILINRSRRASKLHGGAYVVTICRHDIVTRWRRDDTGQTFMKFGENAWKVVPFEFWPPEVQDFVNDGKHERPITTSDRTGRCVCGRKLDGLYLCKRCEASGQKQAAKQAKQKPSRRQQNEIKARAGLERWQRKLKMAQRKVKEYTKRVRYYERKGTSP